MKEKKRRSTQTYTEYTCEECGKKSSWKGDIERCELQHKCKHIEQIYEWDKNDDGWPSYIIGIRLYCKKCRKELGCYRLEDLEDDQKLISQIFKLIEKYNQSLEQSGAAQA